MMELKERSKSLKERIILIKRMSIEIKIRKIEETLLFLNKSILKK